MNFRKLINKKGFFLIAEIGNNHGGDIGLAKRLILSAHKAGADAVKLQYINPESFIHPSQKNRLNQLKKICLDKDQVKKLYSFAKKRGVNLFSSVFDLKEIKFFAKKQKYFKIASGDNNLEFLYKEVSKYKKPTFISTGFLNHKTIKLVYKNVEKYWSKKFSKNNICIMHCVSSYPTKDGELNLRSILELDKNYIKGYSDHSKGIINCIIAFVLGAKVIEKHFTHNKKIKSFRDHELSANYKDFIKLRNELTLIKSKLGNKKKKLSLSESKDSYLSRRSPVYNKNLKKNYKLLIDDIDHLRPEKKKSNKMIKKLINKRLKSKKVKYTYL